MLKTLTRRPRSVLQHATTWIRARSKVRMVESFPDAHELQLGGLEPRLLLSATPISPELLGGDVADHMSSDVGIDGDGVSVNPMDVMAEHESNAESGETWIASEDFNDGIADLFEARVGNWTVNDGRYDASPNGDAISTLRLDGTLPADLDVRATVNADLESGSLYSDGLIIFDYQSPTDFKFAGAYARADRWVIGHRTASTWVTDAYLPETIEASTDYQLRVVIEGDSSVTLFADGAAKLVQNYSDSLTDGEVGVGTWNAVSHFDDVTVQPYVAPQALSMESLPIQEDFSSSSGGASLFEPHVGAWTVSDGRYEATPAGDAISTLRFDGTLPTDLEVQVTANADLESGNLYSDALVIFDYQSPTDFKFAGAYARADRWVIGHRTDSTWVTDSYLSETIEADTDYELRLVIEGDRDATLYVDGTPKVAYDFAESLTDGDVGLGTWNATSQFDDFSVQEHFPLLPTDLEPSVTARLDGTDLHVDGDPRGAIEVKALGHDAYQVSDDGKEMATVEGVSGSIFIKFGGTDDDVSLNLLAQDSPGHVVAALGDGNNSFTVVGGSIGGRLVVRTGDGDDHIALAGDVGRNLVVETGAGVDTVTLLEGSRVAGHAKLTLGDGDDLFSMDGHVGRSLSVQGGDGDDSASLLDNAEVERTARISLGEGDNSFTLAGHVGRNVRVESGDGEDTVDIDSTAYVSRNAVFRLGDGDDRLGMAGHIQRNLVIHTGAGVDTVAFLNDSHVGKVACIDLGRGDDSFSNSATIGRRLHVDYGKDDDGSVRDVDTAARLARCVGRLRRTT